MPYFRLIELFLLCILFQGSFQENHERNGKVFSLFSIVTFPNAGCSSQSTTGSKARNGTCFTSTECGEKGGTVSGNCAAGFGVCCLFIHTAGGSTVSQNCSYIQNPSYPSAYTATTALTYTIAKCASDVCTLRLDFETFTTSGPTGGSDATAAVDTFTITTTPAGQALPPISGENSGYHVYVELGKEAAATSTLTFNWGTLPTGGTRKWEIKVTQLECTSLSRPNEGCLQYYTGTTGRIETFNYNQAGTAKQHLRNQNYNVCIRKAAGFSCVKYTPCSDADAFSISTHAAAKSTLGTACVSDYIEIANGKSCGASGAGFGKVCGLIFNPACSGCTAAMSVGAAACDCSTPLTLGVYTNAAAETIAGTNRGVCLEYQLY